MWRQIRALLSWDKVENSKKSASTPSSLERSHEKFIVCIPTNVSEKRRIKVYLQLLQLSPHQHGFCSACLRTEYRCGSNSQTKGTHQWAEMSLELRLGNSKPKACRHHAASIMWLVRGYLPGCRSCPGRLSPRASHLSNAAGVVVVGGLTGYELCFSPQIISFGCISPTPVFDIPVLQPSFSFLFFHFLLFSF